MSIFEYNEELHLANIRQEGYEEGYKEGLAKAQEEGIRRAFAMLREMGAPESESIQRIAEQYAMDSDKVREIIGQKQQ